MKKSCIGFIFGVILTLTVSVGAQSYFQFIKSDNTLYVDGKEVKMPLYNYEYTNYASIRGVAEALGMDIKVTGTRIDFTSPLTDLETVVKNCKDSCVMVYAHGNGKMKQGSGWVYNGYIITAKHVIEGQERLYIETDNSTLNIPCELYYQDLELDLAILRPTQSLNLPSVKLGSEAKEGEKLVSITSPSYLKNVIDECVFLGKGNMFKSDFFMISESEMAPGSSGGALFNYKSELIGMAAEGTDLKIFYIIPANKIKPILLEQIK